MSIEKIDSSKNCVEEFEDAYHSVVKYLEQVSKLLNQTILDSNTITTLTAKIIGRHQYTHYNQLLKPQHFN